MKKERMTVSDEQRERTLLSEQIERAAASAPSDSPPPPVEEGLKRDETSEKVVLSLAPKALAASASAAGPSGGLKLNPLKPAVNPLKLAANPLKRPNVFKAAALSTARPSTDEQEKMNAKKREAPIPAAERLILEESQRKRRRMEREAVA